MNNSSGVTTAYTFYTSETIPENITLEFEDGASIIREWGLIMINFINDNWWWIGSIFCCTAACVVAWQVCGLFDPTDERVRWEDGEIYLDPRRWNKYKKENK